MDDTDRIVGHSALLGQARDVLRRKHYGLRTEMAYLHLLKHRPEIKTVVCPLLFRVSGEVRR